MALSDILDHVRKSPRLVVFIVFVALLLDNILLTIVVPIIPDYLLELEEADDITAVYYLDPLIWNETIFNSSNFSPFLYNISRLANSSHVTRAGFPIVPEQAAIINENSEVGWLFSSKAIVQLVANPFIGLITNRYGSHVPLFAGFVILTISALLYALGESFAVLFLARSIQGLSSSCTGIAGLTLLADTYSDDKQRSRAMGIALGGISLGVLIGYPVGGLMYQFVGKMTPFLIIALFAIMEGALQLWAFQPHLKTEKPVCCGTPLHILIRDPYILIASGAILFPEMAMAMLEPTLPIWLIDNMDPPKWQLGTVFVPDSIGYVIGTTVYGIWAHRVPRWLSAGFSLLLMGFCLICIPFATQVIHLVMPHFGLGLALGIVDVSIMPLMALLVDTRHVAVYGTVYAIAQVAISLGFALGPALGGEIVRNVGFPWLIRGMGIVNLMYVPCCFFLRDPPSREESKSILMRDQQNQEESFNYQRLNDD